MPPLHICLKLKMLGPFLEMGASSIMEQAAFKNKNSFVICSDVLK